MNKQYSKKKAIFFLRSSGELAGTERNILNWCRHIGNNKYDVIVCSQNGNFWKAFNRKAPLVNFIDYDKEIGDNPKFLQMYRFLKKTNAAKVIWCINDIDDYSLSSIFASWIATAGNAYISHHNFPGEVSSKLWFGFIRGIGLWYIRKNPKAYITSYLKYVLANKIIAVSTETKKSISRYWHISGGRIMVRHTGVDLDVFCPNDAQRIFLRNEFNLSGSTIVFVAINRISEEKRIDRLLGSFLMLLNKNKLDAYLLILGEGTLRSEYQKRIERNDYLRNRVKLLGFRDDVDRYIQGADYVLLASDREGLACVVLEAMACKIIPIVTDSFGTRDLRANVFMSKRNVFDFYKVIKNVLSLSKEEINRFTTNNLNYIIVNNNLQNSEMEDLRAIGLL